MSKHYYIEDISINRKTDDINPAEYVHSIQFDKFSDCIYVNVDQPMGWKKSGKRALRASVKIPLSELKNAYDWLSSDCQHPKTYRIDSNTSKCFDCGTEIKN